MCREERARTCEPSCSSEPMPRRLRRSSASSACTVSSACSLSRNAFPTACHSAPLASQVVVNLQVKELVSAIFLGNETTTAPSSKVAYCLAASLCNASDPSLEEATRFRRQGEILKLHANVALKFSSQRIQNWKSEPYNVFAHADSSMG